MSATSPIDALRALIAEPIAAGIRRYWLIDQSALPGEGWLARHVGRVEWVDLLAGRSETQLNSASPVLLCADSRRPDVDAGMAQELFRVGRFANAISLLASNLELCELQTRLAERARIDLPGSLQAVLRFFDTRTLPLLPRLLSPLQYADFIQGLTRWTYVDRRGVPQDMPRPARGASATTPTSVRLCLDDAQEALLIDDGLTDGVIDFLLTQEHPALRDKSPPDQFELVDPLVDAARAAKLGDPPEVKAFVCTALDEGIDFIQRDLWKDRFDAYRQRRCSIDEVFV